MQLGIYDHLFEKPFLGDEDMSDGLIEYIKANGIAENDFRSRRISGMGVKGDTSQPALSALLDSINAISKGAKAPIQIYRAVVQGAVSLPFFEG